ncbi:MAG: chemotaxis protein CheB, partial [Burkholderiales bacterium]|nr:chemotaxis protein CheB [Burkholderiales bacterium]
MNDARLPAAGITPSPGVRIVGLGASAGGLEPLEQFLARVPAASGLAYLVVQHMDPTHPTLLAELLQRATPMPVHEAVDLKPIEPDTVYVIAPNAEMTVLGGALRLAKPAEPRGQRLPIDVLFGSLARELGDRAIGVVLSGMGSDGTQGLQAIKSQGGLTLAQQPESAQFGSMPASAIAAGCVDIVIPPAEMPMRIMGIVGTQTSRGSPAAEPAGQDGAALETILALLHEHTRHDLALYKSNTLVRR